MASDDTKSDKKDERKEDIPAPSSDSPRGELRFASIEEAIEKGLVPVLPLRDIAVYPNMVASLHVGRTRSVAAVEAAREQKGSLLFLVQRDGSEDNPDEDGLYAMGTMGTIVQHLALPNDSVKILVEGRKRVLVKRFENRKDILLAEVIVVEEKPISEADEVEVAALSRSLVRQFGRYARSMQRIPDETVQSVRGEIQPGPLADMVASNLSLKTSDRQRVLEAKVPRRLELLVDQIKGELELLSVEKRIRSRVRKQMERSQREYYLNEQMKAIRKELGDGEDEGEEIHELEKKIKGTRFTKEALTKAKAELRKLRGMNGLSAEATVARNYLDWLLAVPWRKNRKIQINLKKSLEVLDADHYGLDKVKDRIIEYLAVQARTKSARGQILCLVGPPGVGKSSLGRSVARATGRDFVRISLGGVRDEAEIRGHRRTYIGSMPGRIVQGMKKAGSSNPLFLLDEVDKLGADWRGDPTAALLEVLDPAQNDTFNDHYLEVDYDLSKVMFLTTANTLNMPRPLLDRMEIIRLPGYSEDEKMEIALRHLLLRQRKEHKLEDDEWSIERDALQLLIREYTREAGVRNLEREIAKLMRKAVRDIAFGKETPILVTPENLHEYAGVPKFVDHKEEEGDLVGISTGLAWTEVGGELLSIEAVTIRGKGKASATGTLGDVMRESVQAAESFVKSRALSFGLVPESLERRDIHVHVPEGATPKDGPSAGVAIATAIVSALTGIPVRRDVAMTGEITLRGRILGIGGLKEKLLAAQRSGFIRTVLVPEENRKDMAEVPESALKGLEVVFCLEAVDALEKALVRMPIPLSLPADGAETAGGLPAQH